MIGDDILADTNAVIAWIKQDRGLASVLLSWRSPAISLFTVGELYFGALKSSKPQANKALLEEVRRSFKLLIPDEFTSEAYASIRFDLRKKGRPIPENDVWIASLALQHGLPILTRDAHFHVVDGLTLVSF